MLLRYILAPLLPHLSVPLSLCVVPASPISLWLLLLLLAVSGVFQVCVRHLLNEDNWLRSVCTSIYWGLPSGVDPSKLPPDQTMQHGLSMDETQAGALGAPGLSSSASDSAREEDEEQDHAWAAGGGNRNRRSSSTWSGWDAIAFMYQRSIDAGGAPVPGKAASPSADLYISSRPPDGGGSSSQLPLSRSNTKTNSNSNSKGKDSNSSSSSLADLRRAEPYSAANQLLLQSGQAAEQLFTVRAKDRHTGVMPLFHQVTQKYVHIHPTMGLVGLVPPVIEQERQLRLQQKGEQQQKKKTRRRLRARRHQESQQQQQQQQQQGDNASINDSSSSSNSPQTAGEAFMPGSFLRPCRIEMIPLADLLLQQSVQRVLSSMQDAAFHQQQQQSFQEEAPMAPPPVATAASRCSSSSSARSSDEDGSSDGVVASEGGEDIDPSKSSSHRSLALPLGLASAAAPAADASPATQQPVLLEFHLDDEGVETDVEEGGPARKGSSSSSSSNRNNHGDSQSFYWPTSIDSGKAGSPKRDPADAPARIQQ